MKTKMRLGDLLVENRIITEEQLTSALEIQKKSGGLKLGAILVNLEIVTEEQVLGTLQKKLGIPFVSLKSPQSRERIAIDFPEPLAREKCVFPYQVRGNRLYLATSDPLDYEALNQVSIATGKSIEPILATKKDILAAINRFYHKHNVDEVATTLSQSSVQNVQNDTLEAEMEARVGNVPVVKFISNLLVQAYHKRTSDIHIEPNYDDVVVRFRIDGELVEVTRLNIETHASIITRIKIMGGMDIAERRIPLDGRFNMELDNHEISVRVASMPTVFGEKLVLRIMADSKEGILPLESLGINEQNSKLIRQAITNPNGIILVTGPTGSGKSTTLYSLLNELSTVATNIVTVEDPVEKIVPGVNQTQVNTKAGLTFASGLKAILRQDPDKIMIGEIRDIETAEIAAKAAITGHLVLASLHTNNAASAYMRLVDMGIEPYMIASSVVAVVAQRLVRVICPHCKEVYTPTEADRIFLNRLNANVSTLYIGTGCERCEFTGSLGRTSVHEVILTDSVVRDMIMEKAKSTDIENYLLKEKNQKLLIDDALTLLKEGKIFLKELLNLTQTF